VLSPLYAFALKSEKNRNLGDVIGVLGLTERPKCVVDEGGIIKAARELHRVPSSVTTRVKQLETSLGVTLFHRDRQRLHLSPTVRVSGNRKKVAAV
jgi:hypothetical protein